MGLAMEAGAGMPGLPNTGGEMATGRPAGPACRRMTPGPAALRGVAGGTSIRTGSLIRRRKELNRMTALWQYAVLLGLIAGTLALVATLYLLARSLGRAVEEPGKDVPFAGGTLAPKPAWVRYHIRYYGLALLFLAFDMEMAFMYPWAVVYRELGLTALLDMGVFLAILFLGLLYGWSQGAFKWQ